MFKHASKFNIPIITIIDTPGAYPGISAEETNQGRAIAINLRDMAKLNVPVIAFSSITNSYQILKAIDNTNIQNIIFTIRPTENQNLDYIIHRVFRDLIPLGYNLETKCVRDYKDILEDDFLDLYKLKRVETCSCNV